MNVIVTIEISDINKNTTRESFEYPYEVTKIRFIEKMAKEVKEQMGHNVSLDEMESMLKASHAEAIFDFAVCSDWILDNIPMIAQRVKSDVSEAYKVLSFELIDNGSSKKYDGANSDLRDMLSYMNRDFNEMIREA